MSSDVHRSQLRMVNMTARKIKQKGDIETVVPRFLYQKLSSIDFPSIMARQTEQPEDRVMRMVARGAKTRVRQSHKTRQTDAMTARRLPVHSRDG